MQLVRTVIGIVDCLMSHLMLTEMERFGISLVTKKYVYFLILKPFTPFTVKDYKHIGDAAVFLRTIVRFIEC